MSSCGIPCANSAKKEFNCNTKTWTRLRKLARKKQTNLNALCNQGIGEQILNSREEKQKIENKVSQIKPVGRIIVVCLIDSTMIRLLSESG